MITRVDTTVLAATFRALAVACFAALVPASQGWAASSAWGGAERWVGHQPSEALGADGGSFFALPQVAEQLPRLLTPIKRAVFDSYLQTGPVQQVDHFLVVAKCKAGDCASGNATIILDMNSRNIWFVLNVNENQEVQRCWSGTAQYSALPPALQTSFVD